MGSLGATRGARSRAHVGVAVAAALIVFVLVGLLTAAQARPWRSLVARATRNPHTAMPTPARPTDVLVARSALRDDEDGLASGVVEHDRGATGCIRSGPLGMVGGDCCPGATRRERHRLRLPASDRVARTEAAESPGGPRRTARA